MKPDSLDKVRANAERVSGLMKTLSHPNRLMIVCDLIDEEKSVSDIEAGSGVKQPVLSRELARLRDEGLVTARRESKAVFYRISDPSLLTLMAALCRTWGNETAELAWEPAANSQEMEKETDATFPTVRGQVRGRVRIKPDPYRTE